MEGRMSFIYGLYSPEDKNHFRYIGVSVRPDRRLKEHISNAEKNSPKQGYLGDWIRSLLQKGLTPGIVVLHQFCSSDQAYAEEDYWIKFLRSSGHRLTNTMEGGRGASEDFCRTEESKAQRNASLRKLWKSQEFKETHVAIFNEYWSKKENRKKQSDRVRKYFEDSDNRKKTSDSVHSYLKNEDPVKKQIREQNHRIAMQNPETREKIRKQKNTPENIEASRKRAKAQFSSVEARNAAGQHAKRGWDSYTPEQRANRILKAKLGTSRSKATKNGWMLQLEDVTIPCRRKS